ncbi:tyrosine-type recombinase/integrase [Clostridium cavendishii]|uniref:tyrosine-type recombinase/integrase n=1 Tax=Clostridium cavendishii TaxID=349931 RepID=UPI000A07A04D|nr:tyrosine-type recombinase/integrase [Clostridium cavendishii]
MKFEYVCSWDDGRQLRPLYVTATFTKYVKRYKFKKITFHGLRHSHATILYINGASSHEISKRLRHSRVATTDDIYIHINKEIKKSTAHIFDKAVEEIKENH